MTAVIAIMNLPSCTASNIGYAENVESHSIDSLRSRNRECCFIGIGIGEDIDESRSRKDALRYSYFDLSNNILISLNEVISIVNEDIGEQSIHISLESVSSFRLPSNLSATIVETRKQSDSTWMSIAMVVYPKNDFIKTSWFNNFSKDLDHTAAERVRQIIH